MKEKQKEISHIKEIFLNNINYFLSKKNWTIKNLSDYSNLPYESIKKLVNGKVDNPTIYTVYNVANALGCSIDFLLGKSNISNVTSANLPLRTFSLLEEIINIETQLSIENQKGNILNIPVFVPTGRMNDGLIFDSFVTESIDISDSYRESQDIIMCGIKITSSYFSPTYLNNDVLLIARDRYPHQDEIGIFLVNNRFYIRKYSYDNINSLESITGKDEPLIIKDIDNFHFFGRIITTIRK